MDESAHGPGLWMDKNIGNEQAQLFKTKHNLGDCPKHGLSPYGTVYDERTLETSYGCIYCHQDDCLHPICRKALINRLKQL